ncbi:MAG: hypothetical protein ABGZ53_32735 [Fuerstiella sp.]
MENPNIHRLLAGLKNVQEHDGYWTACCPHHDDTHSSLSITATDDGKLLVRCHVGCDAKEIVYSAGLIWKDMFPEKQQEPAKKITAEYDYHDAEGILVYQVCRLEGEGKKTFLQRRPDGKGGFTWKTKGLKKVLYHLPELQAAPKDQPVFIVEGEKQVDYLRALGLVVTCNTGGAGKWIKSYGKIFTDRDVVIVPDADPPNARTGEIVGAAHAVAVADSCLEYANTIHIVQLPDCGEKWGFDDWLENGHTLEEFGKLLEECPQYPEGEIITRIKPDEDEDMDDPLKRYREHLELIGITYCAQNEHAEIEIFSSHTKRFSEFRNASISYEVLASACGKIVDLKVQRNAEDIGEITIADARLAIAIMSAETDVVREKRGLGCWKIDEDRIAIVKGGKLGILNGRPNLAQTSNPMLDGKAYDIGFGADWVDFDALEEDISEKPANVNQDAIRETVGLVDQFTFLHPDFRNPELITGLILASIMQTCWPIRPQVFLIGQSYSGKTTLLDMVRDLLAPICKKFSGPSAAALRQYIENTAKIALLDELEKSKHRHEIFEMMRAAARGDTLIRGTAGQKVKEYSVWNIFWCGAIESGLMAEADRTRFLTIDMVKASKRTVIPKKDVLLNIGEKLCRSAICSFSEAMRLVETLAEHPFSEAHGRLNECYAIPAAAYAAATGMSDADAVLMYHDFMRRVEVDESIETDHVALLQDIMSAEIRDGSTVLFVHDIVGNEYVDSKLAANRGIAKTNVHYFFNRTLLREILPEKWKDVRIDQMLLRFDGAIRKPKKMGAGGRQCVAIPIATIEQALEGENDNTNFNPFSAV